MTAHDEARPVATLEALPPSGEWLVDHHGIFKLDDGRIPGNTHEVMVNQWGGSRSLHARDEGALLVYRALTENDRLRADVERLQGDLATARSAVRDMCEAHAEEAARAEAAVARAAELSDRINERFDSYHRQGPDYTLDGEPMIYAAFLEELRAALNYQGQDNG